MAEKSIIFPTPMVKAILAGRKNQTRRVVKPQPTREYVQVSQLYFSPAEKKHYVNFSDADDKYCKTFYPKYQLGDVLWVRETWTLMEPKNNEGPPFYLYKADEPDCESSPWFSKWRSSICMSRAAARIFLRVTDVRVERLQEISEEDAIKEGFEGTLCHCSRVQCTDCMNTGWLEPPKVDFIYMWDSLNAKRGFGRENNPWVWVIAFERQ